ncbi:hypothetical protein [Ruegeria sp. EL01]|jgi:hypothetical protein|uniref:hypothetical protein n=1 Tax=Ruegeria sp. EL01 TaxID=2107578 RepID=UPI000EA83328|nr:hypothetical protein [Ruegeria sp. EL01]
MADERNVSWLRVIAVASVIALFVADYVFNLMAKAPPWWAYALPGLLALGIEGPAVGRLLIQIVRAAARVPQEDEKK